MRGLLMFLVPVFLSCTSPDLLAPVSVPLDYWNMVGADGFAEIPSCGRVLRVRVVDKRSESVLGTRSVEDKSAYAPVTTSSDVAVWAERGIEDALHNAGVLIGAEGAPTVRVSVIDITTKENVYRRAGYEARITLFAELVAANGNVYWQKRSVGSAGNYGYAGSVENYQETLNHALDRTIIDLFEATPFENAVCRSSR